MKTLKKNWYIIILGACIACCAILFAFPQSVNAEGNISLSPQATALSSYNEAFKVAYDISDGQFDNYVNNQCGIGNINVRDYDRLLKGKSRKADDAIINYVPKTLFFHMGKYKYVGKEYGFFLESGYHSKVLIFDVINEIDEWGHVVVRVEPILSASYVANYSNMIVSYDEIGNGKNNYAFSDFCIGLSINNQNMPNEINGDFIKRSYVDYKGYKKGGSNGKEFVVNTLKFWGGIAIGVYSPVAATVLGYLDFGVGSIVSLVPSEDTIIKNGAQNYVRCYGESYEEQMQINSGKLNKGAKVGSYSKLGDSVLYSKMGDYYQASFDLQYTEYACNYVVEIDFDVKDGQKAFVTNLGQYNYKVLVQEILEKDNELKSRIVYLNIEQERNYVKEDRYSIAEDDNEFKNTAYAVSGYRDKHFINISREGWYEFVLLSGKKYNLNGEPFKNKKIYIKPGRYEFYFENCNKDEPVALTPITYTIKETIPEFDLFNDNTFHVSDKHRFSIWKLKIEKTGFYQFNIQNAINLQFSIRNGGEIDALGESNLKSNVLNSDLAKLQYLLKAGEYEIVLFGENGKGKVSVSELDKVKTGINDLGEGFSIFKFKPSADLSGFYNFSSETANRYYIYDGNAEFKEQKFGTSVDIEFLEYEEYYIAVKTTAKTSITLAFDPQTVEVGRDLTYLIDSKLNYAYYKFTPNLTGQWDVLTDAFSVSFYDANMRPMENSFCEKDKEYILKYKGQSSGSFRIQIGGTAINANIDYQIVSDSGNTVYKFIPQYSGSYSVNAIEGVDLYNYEISSMNIEKDLYLTEGKTYYFNVDNSKLTSFGVTLNGDATLQIDESQTIDYKTTQVIFKIEVPVGNYCVKALYNGGGNRLILLDNNLRVLAENEDPLARIDIGAAGNHYLILKKSEGKQAIIKYENAIMQIGLNTPTPNTIGIYDKIIYNFTAIADGIYSIADVLNNTTITVSKNGNEIGYLNGGYIFEAGQNYSINVSAIDEGRSVNSEISIDFVPQLIFEGNNSVKSGYYRFIADMNKTYEMSVTNGNISLYNTALKEIAVGSYGLVSGSLKVGETIIIKITGADEEATLKVLPTATALFMGERAKNDIFYAYEPHINGRHQILYDGSIPTLYNSNMEQIAVNTGRDKGRNFIEFEVSQAGKIYYVKCAANSIYSVQLYAQRIDDGEQTTLRGNRLFIAPLKGLYRFTTPNIHHIKIYDMKGVEIPLISYNMVALEKSQSYYIVNNYFNDTLLINFAPNAYVEGIEKEVIVDETVAFAFNTADKRDYTMMLHKWASDIYVVKFYDYALRSISSKSVSEANSYVSYTFNTSEVGESIGYNSSMRNIVYVELISRNAIDSKVSVKFIEPLSKINAIVKVNGKENILSLDKTNIINCNVNDIIEFSTQVAPHKNYYQIEYEILNIGTDLELENNVPITLYSGSAWLNALNDSDKLINIKVADKVIQCLLHEEYDLSDFHILFNGEVMTNGQTINLTQLKAFNISTNVKNANVVYEVRDGAKFININKEQTQFTINGTAREGDMITIAAICHGIETYLNVRVTPYLSNNNYGIPSEECVKLDFTKGSHASSLTIPADVKLLYLTGSSNAPYSVQFIVAKRIYALTVIFNNFKAHGNGDVLIHNGSSTLELEFVGNCMLQAGQNGNNGGTAINAPNVEVILKIQAGASVEINGGDGLSITEALTPGSDGNKGDNGVQCTHWEEAVLYGKAGGNGTDGMNGNDGGNGGVAIKCILLKINNSGKIVVHGGSGGNGQNGSRGGNGGIGGIGAPSHDRKEENGFYGWDVGGTGGDGGHGGKGGRGGNGGDGALALDCSGIVFTGNSLNIFGGTGGNGGNGAKGGDGGTGGRGGADNDMTGGREGDGGNGGNGGAGGDRGAGGKGSVGCMINNNSITNFAGLNGVAGDTAGTGGKRGEGGKKGEIRGGESSKSHDGDPGSPGADGK